MTAKISRYIEVAVPLPLRGPLTYRVPEGMTGHAGAGARAVVPVGRRWLTGVILGEGSPRDIPEARIKDVKELPDEVEVLPPSLVSLIQWAARYYVTSPGGMMAAALPPGTAFTSELVVTRASAGPEGPVAAARREDRALLESIPFPGGIAARRLDAPPARLRRLEKDGLVRLEAVLKPPRVGPSYSRRYVYSGGDLQAARERCRRAPRQREVLDLVASRASEGMTQEEIVDRLGKIGDAAAALARKGLVTVRRIEVRRRPAAVAPAEPDATHRHVPTPDQAAALTRIGEALDEAKYSAFLLMGVTGSGKTEVYLGAIERCLAQGRSAIYLVPEITLTPLLARNLRQRLGGRLAILHSSLSPGERFDEWRRARRGQARIVLGARSAVLSPVEDVGLIVVDEEQDGSYKQEEDPRYNARDLALVRGRDARAVVILGSATPSVESYSAGMQGRYGLLKLPRRILERSMATVRVVDMRKEYARIGREHLISEPLQRAMTAKLERGDQAILLLNRRGYAPFLLCRTCGSSEGCLRCSVALTYHRSDALMRCHYCGYHKGLPRTCSTCGSDKTALSGFGTERLEEHLREAFPGARIARLDRDTARGRRAPAEILGAFERGEFNLLVGTQMVAKGHDFPGVTIVGVVGADAALAMPDFRAAERTFQLLTQVAGRSGRGTEPGEVLVQAYHCDHYAIRTAANQDFDAFHEQESRFRRIMKYPPYSVMANVLVQADDPESGVRRAKKAGEILRAAARGSAEVIGPSVAPLARLKGRYRYQILVRGKSRRKLSDVLNVAAENLTAQGLKLPREVIIDIDPVSML